MDYGRLDVFWPDGLLKTFPLSGETVSIGRSAGSTIQLETEAISRYHVSLTYKEDQVSVTDMESANGTFVDGVRLKPNELHVLYGGEEIQIGDLRLIFHPYDESPTQPVKPLDDTTQRIEMTLPDHRIEMVGPHQAIPPGAYIAGQLSIFNIGEERERYTVEVSGVPKEWVRVDRPELYVQPGETEHVMVNFKPLRRSESRPGEYPVLVRVRPQRDPEKALDANIVLHVLPFGGFGMALSTSQVRSGELFILHLHNQGNANLSLIINSSDPDSRLRYELASRQVVLQPGQRLGIQGRVYPQTSLLFGSPRQRPFDLSVRSQDAAGFTAAVRGTMTEKPSLPAWALPAGGVILALVVLSILAGLILLLQPPPAQPVITAFQVNSTQVAQGQLIGLTWLVTDVASLTISVNGTPMVSEIDPAQVPGVDLDTSNLAGSVILSLSGVNGDNRAEASQTVYIYRPMTLVSFNVEPPQMLRYVVQTMTINWNIDGAVSTWLSGWEGFNTTSSIQGAYNAQDTVQLSGLPLNPFTITLFAQDETGGLLQQSFTIEMTNPECLPSQQDTELHVGPDVGHQIVGTVPLGVRVIVDAQDGSGQWLRVQLSGGVSGWAPRTAFVCGENFQVENLRKILDVPTPPPSATPLPSPSTPIPRSTLNSATPPPTTRP